VFGGVQCVLQRDVAEADLVRTRGSVADLP
jgi:hypothetical protein